MPITSLDQLDLSKRYTYADYVAWQFDQSIELLKGFISQMAAPSPKHQTISVNIVRIFSNFLHRKPCRVYHAPFDVRLVKNKEGKTDKEIYTVVQPDLCLICDLEKLDDRGCLGAPELIIEIVSPNNSRKDIKDKFALYEENGVQEYWIVRPYENSVEKFVLENEKYQQKGYFTQEDKIRSFVLPDLEIDLTEVFEE